jgi:hypothetical protein
VLTDAKVHVVAPAQARALGERIGALCRFIQAEP